MSLIDRYLADSDPAPDVVDPRIDDVLARMSRAARDSTGPGRHSRRRKIALPLVLVGAVVLTGAAAAALSPLWFYRDGEQTAGDVVISIDYTTPQGAAAECTYEVQFGGVSANGSDPLPTNFDELIADLSTPGRWDHFKEQVDSRVITTPGSRWVAVAGDVFREQLPEELSALSMSVSSDCMDMQP